MTTRPRKLIFGFTLVELLVAVLVIGILAAIAIPTFLGQRNRAYDTEAISALKNTQTAIMTVLAGELEMPRPVEALVAALEEIEPVYTFVAVNPANADGYAADGPEHVGSRWSDGGSEILVWYGSIYAAKLSESGTCFVTRMLEPSGEWQWLRFDPNEVLTEEGDPMPCGGLEFVSNLKDIVADNGLVWTDDPQGKKPSATQTDDGYDPTQPGSGDPGDGSEDPGSGYDEGTSVDGDFPANPDGTLGAPWEVVFGDVRVKAGEPNVAYVNSTSALALVDVGTSHGELRVRISDTGGQEVYLRYVDENNWVRWEIVSDFTNYVRAQLVVRHNGNDQTLPFYTHYKPSSSTDELLLRAFMLGDWVYLYESDAAGPAKASFQLPEGLAGTRVGFGRSSGTGGEHRWFADFSFAPLHDIDPEPARNLYAQDSAGPVTLAWQSSYSMHVDHYKVVRNGSTIGTTGNLTFTDTGAQVGVSYTYAVVAVSVTGNESAPVTVAVTVGANSGPVSDDFDRADGELGSTPVGNVPWSVVQGSAGLAGNRAVTQSSPSIFALNPGFTNGELRVDVNAFRYQSVYLRVVDADNWVRWTVFQTPSSGNNFQVQLQVRQGGVTQTLTPDNATNPTMVFTATGTTSSNRYLPVRIQMYGDKIALYALPDDPHPAYIFTVSEFTSAPLIGMGYDYTSSGGAWFDNFSFIPAQMMDVPAPFDLVVTDTTNKVTLSWEAPLSVAFDRFEVRRNGQVIGSTTDSTFTDVDVVAGQTYSYEVVAHSVLGTSSAAAKQDVVVSSGAPTSIEDDFTRPAGVGGLGVTSDGNASWMVVSGSILYDEAGPFAHAVVPDSIMVVDAGTSEGTLEFEGSWRQYTGMYVRYVDANNWVRLQNTRNSSSQAQFQLQVMTGGVLNTYETTPNISISSSDRSAHFKVVVDSESIAIYRNPTEATPTYTWSNSDHADATKVGWGANGQDNKSRVLRYFKFTPAS